MDPTKNQYRFEFRDGLWRADPATFAEEILQIRLQPFQAEALDPGIRKGLLNCSRQVGKTLVMAIKTVHLALSSPKLTAVVLCPTEKQVGQFFTPILEILRRLGYGKLPTDKVHTYSVVLPNGSVIIGLSALSKYRGLAAVHLLIVDEAAEVPDAAFDAVTPMMATTAGKGPGGLWLASTPAGKVGMYWRLWSEGGDEWTRLSIPAWKSPLISAEFLESERRIKSDLIFRQEYGCEFVDTPDSLFREDLVRRSVRKNVRKLWNN